MDVDSLDIKISAEAKKANDAIDSIIRNLGRLTTALNIDTSKLGNIGKNLNFSEITNSAKTMSENVSRATAKVAESMKPIEVQTKKITRTFQELAEPYKDLGKGFVITGSTEDIQRKIDKLKNSLAEAKLKEEDLRLSGKTDLSGYETAVKNVVKLENQLESLEKQLESINNTQVKLQFDVSGLSDKDLDEMLGFPTIHRQADEVTKSIDNVTESLRESGEEFKNQWSGVQLPDLSVNKTDLSSMTDLELDEWFKNLPSVKEQAEEVNESLSKISETAERVGEAVKGAWSGIQLPDLSITQTGFVDDIDAKIDALRQKFKDVGTEFVFKGNAEQLTKEINKVSAELDKLYARQDKMISLGKVDTAGFEALQYDISEASNKLEVLRNTVAETGASVQQSSFSFSSFGSVINNAFSGMMKTLQKVNRAINSVLSKLGKLIKSMFLLGNSAKSSGKGFNLSLMTILKYGLGIRSLYVLFNKLRNAVKEGMENLIQYSDRTNQSVSMLKSSLNQFKNSAAAAFAPVLNAIAPALNTLIQLFIRATNAVNQFFAALTGQSTWIKAKYVYEDAAEKISGAAKAAKGALQPFDKLNNLTSQTGAGGGGALPEDMFETKPIEDKFKNFLDWLKSMWDKADFTDLGNLLGQKLKDALDNIPWTEIKEKARKIAKSLATLINGFIETEGLGYSIGRTLAEAINTAYEFLNEFVHTLHWESVGHFIADTLNGFFESIDWELIKDTFVTGFKGLADAINKFIEDFHWDNVSNTISNAINTIAETVYTFFSTVKWGDLGKNLGEQLRKSIEKIDWEKVGMALGSIVQAALDFLISFVKEQDLSEVAKAIMDTLKGFFKTVDAGDLATVILTVIAAKLALKATQFAFANAAKSILGSLGSSISASAATTGGIAAAGASIGTVLIGGIAGVLIGGALGKLLDNYILAPLMSFDEELSEQYKNFKWFGEDGFFAQFKASFTDGSWKEALKLWGDDIYNGFLAVGNDLDAWWTDTQTTVRTKLSEIETAISDKWNEIKTGASTKLTEIQTGISTKLATIKTNWFTAWETLKGKVTTIFSGITTTIGNAINSILTKIDTLVQKIKGVSGKAQSALGGISFGGGIGNIVGNATGKRTATYNAGISTASVYNYDIPMYSAGGFPKTYSLFSAGENGVAELLGTVGGKTAVAGGTEITGIADAVRLAGSTEANLLKVAISLLQEIADKPTISDRDIFDSVGKQYGEKAKRNGYSRDPVFG